MCHLDILLASETSLCFQKFLVLPCHPLKYAYFILYSFFIFYRCGHYVHTLTLNMSIPCGRFGHTLR